MRLVDYLRVYSTSTTLFGKLKVKDKIGFQVEKDLGNYYEISKVQYVIERIKPGLRFEEEEEVRLGCSGKELREKVLFPRLL